MKWLALDCSTEKAFVSIGETQCLAEASLQGVRSHSQSLLQEINRLLSEQQWHTSDIDAIIFGRGPGSFTGLRVACSLVQGLAMALQVPVYPVSGLQAIAHHLRMEGETRPIITAIDARMNELYWSYYQGSALKQAKEQVSTITALIMPDEPVVMAGVGVEAFLPQLSEQDKSCFQTVLTMYPCLNAMVDLVKQQVIKPVTADKVIPVYIRNKVTQGASGG